MPFRCYGRIGRFVGITPPLTGQQMNQFFKDYPINGTGKGTGYCFSKALPV